MCTLSQNGYGANPLPSEGTLTDITSNMLGPDMSAGRVDHIHVTDIQSSLFPLASHHKFAEPTQKNKGRVEQVHVTRGH